MTSRLAGKTALITGAAEGLGRGIAERFAAEGARVIVTDVQAEKGTTVAAELGPDATFLELDVADEGNWIRVIGEAQARFGGFDVLVNNAAVVPLGTIEDADFDQWKRTLAVNADGVFLGCHHALPVLEAHAPASIVTIASAVLLKGYARYAAYSASKGAIKQLNRSMALHCAPRGIRCNLVSPGSIMTPMQDRVMAEYTAEHGMTRDEYLEEVRAEHPLGRIATPMDVAHAVVFLASDEASFITGAHLAVDGGLTL